MFSTYDIIGALAFLLDLGQFGANGLVNAAILQVGFHCRSCLLTEEEKLWGTIFIRSLTTNANSEAMLGHQMPTVEITKRPVPSWFRPKTQRPGFLLFIMANLFFIFRINIRICMAMISRSMYWFDMLEPVPRNRLITISLAQKLSAESTNLNYFRIPIHRSSPISLFPILGIPTESVIVKIISEPSPPRVE